jgi:NAD(P)-dependent dehydrogenase (short-subunit alcohol dehydrogenase family)
MGIVMARASLENKVIAVTGAGSGIGRALALALARRGAKLALADRDAAGLAETRQMLGNAHHVAEVFDVRDADGWQRFATAAQSFGGVDGVINNAGLSVVAPFADMSEDDFNLVMDVNFYGVVRGTRTFLPLVKTRPKSWIVNISSVFGLMAYPTQSSYCASKFAVKGLTETLRLELSQTDPSVQVICVHPGGVKTDVARNAKFVKGLGDDATNHMMAAQNFDKAAKTTPEKAAEMIVSAMESGEVRVRIGPDSKIIDWLVRLLPRSYFSVIGRMMG